MIPAHLLSECASRYPLCPGCAESVKQDPMTGRFYITMGHAGFNTVANNHAGYQSEKSARLVIQHLMAR